MQHRAHSNRSRAPLRTFAVKSGSVIAAVDVLPSYTR